ncbi:MAG: cytochrome c [Planctomycetes bacterium]|nr:cytochrome c [Planctomycetota bacterium]
MATRTPPFAFATSVVLALVITSGCNTTKVDPNGMTARIPAPQVGADKSATLPGLHNVVTYADDIVCGGVPEGEEGLHTLAAMGIKTIVSVDGATPDVAIAEQLGMRYVHLPISYDTVTPERQKQLAQALSSCEQPIYMHCHHGKHRSAAALGSAMVMAGKLTPEVAQQRMKVSGTAKEYTGLWQAVAEAKPLPAAELKVDPKSLPSITKVSGMVATMAEIDLVIDLVKQAHKAGWKAPDDHPDLVATKETARLAGLFANLQNDQESKALPGDYQTMLQQAIDGSKALDVAVRNGDQASAEKQLAALNKGCKECHVKYRDK